MAQQRSFYPDEETVLILDAIPKGQRNKWINEAIVLASQQSGTNPLEQFDNAIEEFASRLGINEEVIDEYGGRLLAFEKRLDKLERLAERQGAY